jgi:hypothetical protein
MICTQTINAMTNSNRTYQQVDFELLAWNVNSSLLLMIFMASNAVIVIILGISLAVIAISITLVCYDDTYLDYTACKYSEHPTTNYERPLIVISSPMILRKIIFH